MSSVAEDEIGLEWFQFYLVTILTSTRDRVSTQPLHSILEEVDAELRQAINRTRLNQDRMNLLACIPILGTEYNALLDRWREAPPTYDRALQDLHFHNTHLTHNEEVLAEHGLTRNGPKPQEEDQNDKAPEQSPNVPNLQPYRKRGRPTKAEMADRAAATEQAQAAVRHVVLSDEEHLRRYGAYEGYVRATMGVQTGFTSEHCVRILPYLLGTDWPSTTSPVDSTASSALRPVPVSNTPYTTSMAPPARPAQNASCVRPTAATVPAPVSSSAATAHTQTHSCRQNYANAGSMAAPPAPRVSASPTLRTSASPAPSQASGYRLSPSPVRLDPNMLPPNPFSSGAVESAPMTTSHVQVPQEQRSDLPFTGFVRSFPPALAYNAAPMVPSMVPTKETSSSSRAPAPARTSASRPAANRNANRAPPAPSMTSPSIDASGPAVPGTGVLIPNVTTASPPRATTIPRFFGDFLSHEIAVPPRGQQPALQPGQNTTTATSMGGASMRGGQPAGQLPQRGPAQPVLNKNWKHYIHAQSSVNQAPPRNHQPAQQSTQRSPPRAAPPPQYQQYQQVQNQPGDLPMNRLGLLAPRVGHPSFYGNTLQARGPPPGPYHRLQQQQQGHVAQIPYGMQGMHGMQGASPGVQGLFNQAPQRLDQQVPQQAMSPNFQYDLGQNLQGSPARTLQPMQYGSPQRILQSPRQFGQQPLQQSPQPVQQSPQQFGRQLLQQSPRVQQGSPPRLQQPGQQP